MTSKRTQTERVCYGLVKYVSENPMCSRFEASKSISLKYSTIYPWELIKHLFHQHGLGKNVKYTRTKEAFNIKETPRKPSYKGVSDKTKSVACRIEALMENADTYTGLEIRKRLKISLSIYKKAIFEAKIDRHSGKGKGYLYSKVGRFPEKQINVSTKQISTEIFALIEKSVSISGEKIRSELGVSLVNFRTAMKFIIRDVRKTTIKQKPHYSLGSIPSTFFDGDDFDDEARVNPMSVINLPILTKWHGGNPFAMAAQ